MDKRQLRGKISSILGLAAGLKPKLKGNISQFETELAVLRLQDLENPSYINKVIKALENIEECTFYGSPKFDFNVTGFKNGVLDHKKKVLMPWSPKFFISHALPFNYDPTATCEKFRSYLDDICEKNNDRKMFLKSFAWALIHGRSSFQVMLHLIGPGGTGKSIFGLLMTALVGKEVTVTTTLKAIQGNSFENSNLVDKKLILVSDA